MSRALDFDPFVHPPLAAERRERLRAEGAMGPAGRELTFDQFLDTVNPLHHIPVVGAIYRALTGDTIDSAASVVGSIIYGGPIGMVAGLINAVVREDTGHDLGSYAMAMVTGDELTPEPDANLAVQAPGTRDGAPAATENTENAAPQSAATAAPELIPQAILAADTPPSVAGQKPGSGAVPTSPAPSLASGQVLEGDDALAALAADLRAAVSGGSSVRQGAAGRVEPMGSVPASTVPPPDSFMPLSQNAFSGPRLASDLKAEHARKPNAIGSGNLFPTSLNVAADKSDIAADKRESGRTEVASPAVAAGLLADPRFAAQAAPQANFADRMMEALRKYRALEMDSGASDTLN